MSPFPTGSPPRAWGQLHHTVIGVEPNRFTPTCVGTMIVDSFVDMAEAVHPHVRGDNYSQRNLRSHHARFTPTCVGTINTSNCCVIGKCGSPPRAWGQCSYAGPTALFMLVHPHVRGDNNLVWPTTDPYTGSPPRAWGQCIRKRFRCVRHRFTPTCVGTIIATYRCTP